MDRTKIGKKVNTFAVNTYDKTPADEVNVSGTNSPESIVIEDFQIKTMQFTSPVVKSRIL